MSMLIHPASLLGLSLLLCRQQMHAIVVGHGILYGYSSTTSMLESGSKRQVVHMTMVKGKA